MKYKLMIKKWRKKRKISQRKLSFIIGISQSFISEIESGKKNITVDMLYRIASALEVCPRVLLGCEDIECNNCTTKCKTKGECT